MYRIFSAFSLIFFSALLVLTPFPAEGAVLVSENGSFYEEFDNPIVAEKEANELIHLGAPDSEPTTRTLDESSHNTEWLRRMNEMQATIQTLEGKVEEQAHEIRLLQQRLDEAYRPLQQRVISSALNTSSSLQENLSTLPTEKGISVDNLSIVAPKNDEESQYLVAYKLVKAKRTVEAQHAMQTYIRDYPQSSYLPNAYYWLGQIYLEQKEYEKAREAFHTLIHQFPQSSRAADAHLKLAAIYAEQGQAEHARRELTKVQKEFPDTTSARLATEKLQTLSE